MMMNANCAICKSIKKEYKMSEFKRSQYEKVLESIRDVERCLHEFEEEEKKELELFLMEIRHKVLREIQEALESGEYFGCWLHANHNRMPFILGAIEQVRERCYDAPRVRVLKDAVVDALEELFDAKPKSCFD